MWFTFNKKVSKYIQCDLSDYILYNMFISFFCGATIEKLYHTIVLNILTRGLNKLTYLLHKDDIIIYTMIHGMYHIFIFNVWKILTQSLSSLAYYSFRLYLKHNLHVHKNSWSLNFICIIFFFIIFFVGKVRKRERTRISKRI